MEGYHHHFWPSVPQLSLAVVIPMFLFLLLLLSSLLLIKGISIECRVDQLVFVCSAAIGMQMILWTNLV
jgi:hypothetical protein